MKTNKKTNVDYNKKVQVQTRYEIPTLYNVLSITRNALQVTNTDKVELQEMLSLNLDIGPHRSSTQRSCYVDIYAYSMLKQQPKASTITSR